MFSVKELQEATTNRNKDMDNTKISWLYTHEILIQKAECFNRLTLKSVGLQKI